jgi:hypothetical protein
MIALGAWVVVGASDGRVLFGGVCMLAGGIGWFGYMLVFTLKTAGSSRSWVFLAPVSARTQRGQ